MFKVLIFLLCATVPHTRKASTEPTFLEEKRGFSPLEIPLGHPFKKKLPFKQTFRQLDIEITEKNKASIPFWMDFDSKSRTLSGTAVNEDRGSYTLTVTDFDKEGKRVIKDFTLEVVQQPSQEEKQKDLKEDYFDLLDFWHHVEKNELSSPPNSIPQEKEFILFIGNTGSGKSTTINYLCANPLAKERRDTNEIIVLQDWQKRYPQIGHEGETTTLFPRFYSDPQKPFVYIDTPGWIDSRGKEVNLFNIASLNHLITHAKKIKSIFCIISLNDITGRRGGFFVDFIKQLNMVIDNMTGHLPNIFWVFTKVLKGSTKQDFLDEIQHIKEIKSSKKEKREQDYIIGLTGNDRQPIEEVVKILTGIITYGNIFLIDPLDQGRSRQKIFGALQKINKDIPSDAFKIPTKYEYRDVPKNLKKAFYSEKLFKGRVPEQIKKLEKRIQQQKADYEKVSLSTSSSETPLPERYQAIITKKKKEKKALQKKIEKIKKEEYETEKKRYEIQPLFFSSNSIPIDEEFKFPFLKEPEIRPKKGNLTGEKLSKKEGKYKYEATYEIGPLFKSSPQL
ncbi:MAG: putative Ig domain-containing protein, partial [Bacteroidota bacterium]